MDSQKQAQKSRRNDVVNGLVISFQSLKGKMVKEAKYLGPHGKGYDGCGTHTHKD